MRTAAATAADGGTRWRRVGGSGRAVIVAAGSTEAACGGGLRRRMPLRRPVRGPCPGTGPPPCRAMRYYRLWIYTCNAALFMAAIAFCGAAARTLIFDYRRQLVPSLTLYQPSFLYACLALATQGGALQVLGCMGALRLSERLLNAYWLLLLVLLFGDVVLGAFWAFRFERICLDLRPALRARLWRDYEVDTSFARLWDRLQGDTQCCGVPSTSSTISTTAGFVTTTGVDFINNTRSRGPWDTLPASCCAEHAVNASKCIRAHSAGCDERLLDYLHDTASVLAILGYCVMAFLKLCFLGILRYEIREMIQKIRLLRAELELPNNLNGTLPAHLCASDSERESLLQTKTEVSTLLSSPPAPSKNPPNGNNNYELREYPTRRSNATTDENI
ncbi:CD63 antigen-like [Agrilus planipennis]|uniref:CD63 antigen-like n=1 Tax=Agrilus planipennis TaxID=224129 RepID=A0A1W4W963_AGRPL|nr:CD63 antigen-like [Agrilus planipennis]XP_025829915.1 CD63 antigen-like [Agrilus planipennis]